MTLTYSLDPVVLKRLIEHIGTCYPKKKSTESPEALSNSDKITRQKALDNNNIDIENIKPYVKVLISYIQKNPTNDTEFRSSFQIDYPTKITIETYTPTAELIVTLNRIMLLSLKSAINTMEGSMFLESMGYADWLMTLTRRSDYAGYRPRIGAFIFKSDYYEVFKNMATALFFVHKSNAEFIREDVNTMKATDFTYNARVYIQRAVMGCTGRASDTLGPELVDLIFSISRDIAFWHDVANSINFFYTTGDNHESRAIERLEYLSSVCENSVIRPLLLAKIKLLKTISTDTQNTGWIKSLNNAVTKAYSYTIGVPPVIPYTACEVMAVNPKSLDKFHQICTDY